MLSSLKKRSDKSSAVVVPAWHPNFRNVATLPDTKAVRTSFFINVLAVFAAATLGIYAGYKEYDLRLLQADTNQVRSDVQASKSANDKAVALYGKFKDEERKVADLQAFLSISKIKFSDFVLQVGAFLPPEIILTSVDYRAAGVTLRGGIGGAPDEASGRAVEYVEGLRKNPAFSAIFDPITLTNIVRDPGTSRMQFVIDLTFKGSVTKPAGGAK
jgi:hypothetical protein